MKKRKVKLKNEKQYYNQYKNSVGGGSNNGQRNLVNSKSEISLFQETPQKHRTESKQKSFRIKRSTSKIIEKIEDEDITDSVIIAQTKQFTPENANQEFSTLKQFDDTFSQSNQFSESQDRRTKTAGMDVQFSNIGRAKINIEPIKQNSLSLKSQNQLSKSNTNFTQSHKNSNNNINNTLQTSQWTQSNHHDRKLKSSQGSIHQGQNWNVTQTSTLFGKEQILLKNSNLNGTAVRFWNGMLFNPGQVVNQDQNKNVLLPQFYHGPKYKKLQQETSDSVKMQYFLKKEIEEYKNNQKPVKHSPKDLMIKMLIDEVDKQHLRINFLEKKVREQRAKILKLEDALFQRSHRLLLRCTSSSIKNRDYLYEDDQEKQQVSSRSRISSAKPQYKSGRSSKLRGYSKKSNKNKSKSILGNEQDLNDSDPDIERSQTLNIQRSQSQELQVSRHLNMNNDNNGQDQELLEILNNKNDLLLNGDLLDAQIELVQEDELKLTDMQKTQNQNNQSLIMKQSIILKYQDQDMSKLMINKDGLLNEICGRGQSKQQIEINVNALINDLEKSVYNLKQLSRMVNYQQTIQLKSDKSLNFFRILEEFQRKAEQIINCEKVLFLMLDVPTQELIQFTRDNVIKIKWEELFQFDINALKDQITKIGHVDVSQVINHDQFKFRLQIPTSHKIESIIINRFQVLGKQGIALAINSQTFKTIEDGEQIPEFNLNDNEILNILSATCLRMLNRERDFDLKNRMIKAYKGLFKIGINLNSRSNYASLLYEAERRLSEIMGTDNTTILIIDHDEEIFIKLNYESLKNIESSDQINFNQVQTYNLHSTLQLVNQNNQPNTERHTDGHLAYVPMRGLAQISIQNKKTLVVTEPQIYPQYDSNIDILYQDGQVKPIICVPIMNQEDDQRVEGCIEVEFKMKHYLSSNPLLGGSFGEFKLDLVTREILEIFSNQVRISIERLNTLRKYQNRKSRGLGANLNHTYAANRSPSPFGRFDNNYRETEEQTVKIANENKIEDHFQEDLQYNVFDRESERGLGEDHYQD
ncbi:UNKNOWN [Stylonychia lemnae]|uniref:GAF domain-containing protein n=1 Tax=Stylonychia lemnae TaxID=5949 RepID=A0A078B4T7_STYLE|nr:UNKNOWN [Stylonychia lemnae]|eukprot:CDW89545.1 UNKNOWN [Stylonychia lemnae]